MTRLKAAATHLIINIAIFSVLLVILLFFWFPSPYFTASGGLQGIKIVVLIDVVLGPLLTFIVASPNKARAVFKKDMLVIILLQLSALVWGVYAIHQQRPVATVFWEQSFYTVPYEEFTKANATRLATTSDGIPLLYTEKPENRAELKKLVERITAEPLPPYAFTDYQSPYQEHFDTIKDFSYNIDEVIAKNQRMKHQLEVILQARQLDQGALYYIPLVSKYRNIIIVFDQAGNVAGYLQAPLKK